MPECPECNKTFDTEHGLKCHHGAKHDGSYGKTKVECVICGEEKLIPPSKENVENHTCSKECNKKWREKHYSGENNPMYGEERSEEVKKKLREKIDNSGQKNPMYGKTGEENPNYGDNRPEHSKKMSGNRNPMYGKTGEDHARGGMSNSKEHNQAIKKAMLGESHPWRGGKLPEKHRKKIEENTPRGEEHWNWKGGIAREVEMGSNWERQREKAIQRDGEECLSCGMTRQEHYENYGRDISVDHIIPRRFFEDIENEANLLSNLRTYCIKCHIEKETDKDFLSPMS